MKVLTAVEVLAEGWLVFTIGETEEADHLGDQKAGEGYWTQVQKSYVLRILVLPPICSITLDKLLPPVWASVSPFTNGERSWLDALEGPAF